MKTENPLLGSCHGGIIYLTCIFCLSCEVIRDQKSGDSLQFAFVEFENVSLRVHTRKNCQLVFFWKIIFSQFHCKRSQRKFFRFIKDLKVKKEIQIHVS